MKTLVIQSFRTDDIPDWIARCMASVRAWAASKGHEYLLTDDSAFQLCGEDYLAKVGDNKRSITNLCRLELLRLAHLDHDRAIWMDADVFVYDPAAFSIDVASGYAFARETFVYFELPDRWLVQKSVNNSVIACMAGEPDLDLIIHTTRHIARHHAITSNYQVGGDIIKGLHRALHFPVLDNVGMFSPYIVAAVTHGHAEFLDLQAKHHGTPTYAANLCVGPHYSPRVSEADAMTAMDILEATRGGVLNDRLAPAP